MRPLATVLLAAPPHPALPPADRPAYLDKPTPAHILEQFAPELTAGTVLSMGWRAEDEYEIRLPDCTVVRKFTPDALEQWLLGMDALLAATEGQR
jgi:hypothetical protein